MDTSTQGRRGRPKKYHTEEDRKRAITASKTKYMLGRLWFCNICNNDKNYTLAGKTAHTRTIKHRKNIEKNT